jgi:phage gpG-like protein
MYTTMSMDQFVDKVMTMKGTFSDPNLLKNAARAALVEVKDELRHRFGVYPAIVPAGFEPWQQLRYKTKWNRRKLGFPANQPLLRTGALKNSYQITEIDGNPALGSNSDYAQIQEEGSGSIARRLRGIKAVGGGAAIGAKHAANQVASMGIPPRSTIGIAFAKRESRAFDKALKYIQKKGELRNIDLGLAFVEKGASIDAKRFARDPNYRLLGDKKAPGEGKSFKTNDAAPIGKKVYGR